MATLDFDDYDSILSSLHTSGQQIPSQVKEEDPDTMSAAYQSLFSKSESSNPFNFEQNLLQQQQQQQPLNGFQPSMQQRLSTISETDSQMSSDLNFNDLNDAMSSYNSGILSPYSSGSSPDDFFLSSGNNRDNLMNDAAITAATTNNLNNHTQLQPPNVQHAIIPMAECASNTTVTFNSSEQSEEAAMNDLPSLTASARTVSTNSAESIAMRKDIPDADTSARKKSNVSTTQKATKADAGVTKPGKKIKSSHNLIEKKYRTNINSKIVELRNCVPALRIVVSKNHNHRTSSVNDEEEQFDDDYEGNGYSDDEERLDGLKPAKKLNKATILAKATEYIKHLEWKNEVLQEKNEKLSAMLSNANLSSDSQFSCSQQLYQQPVLQQQPTYYSNSGSSMSSSGSGSSNASPTNMNVGQPMQQQSSQLLNEARAYPQQQQQYGNSLTNKLLLGGMTAMLGASSFDDFSSSSSTGGSSNRGLFSVPIMAFSSSSSSTAALFNSSLIRPFIGCVKLSMFFAAVYYYFLVPFVTMFSHEEQSDEKVQHNVKVLTFNEVVEKLFEILCDPVGFYRKVTYVQTANVEFQINKSLETSAPDSKFYSTFFKCWNLESNPYHSFLKSMYFKRCSELSNTMIKDSRLSISSIPIKLFNVLIVDRFGALYWKSAAYNASSSEDKQLIYLLENYSYKDIELKSLPTDESANCLVDSLAISLTDDLITEASRRMISLEALNKKLADKNTKTSSNLDNESRESLSTARANSSEDLIDEKFKLEIAALRIQVTELLNNAIEFSSVSSNTKQKLHCLILTFLLKPNSDNLSRAFKILKSSNEDELDQESRIGLICCVLKFQLLNFDGNYNQVVSWLNKLKLPNFTNNFSTGGQLGLFEFVCLFNVFNLITFEFLQKVDSKTNESVPPSSEQSVEGTEKDNEMDNLEDDDDDEDEDDDDDEDLSSDSVSSASSSAREVLEQSINPKASISKLNFKIINILANMRIFVGNAKNGEINSSVEVCDSEDGEDFNLKDYLIDGFLSFIEKLNGF